MRNQRFPKLGTTTIILALGWIHGSCTFSTGPETASDSSSTTTMMPSSSGAASETDDGSSEPTSSSTTEMSTNSASGESSGQTTGGATSNSSSTTTSGVTSENTGESTDNSESETASDNSSASETSASDASDDDDDDDDVETSNGESETEDAETSGNEESGDDGELCTPHSTKCTDATHVQICDQNGMWLPPQLCVDQACVGNQCSGVCSPETTKCVDLSQFQTCEDNGIWSSPMVCVDQTCVEDQCQGECSQDQKRCLGDDAQNCSATGVWEIYDTCSGVDQTCVDGECVESCSPWIEQLGTSDLDSGHGIAVAPSGEVYITGYTKGRMSDMDNSQGFADVYLIKYQADGSKLWSRQFGSSAGDYGYGIAIDSSGFVYITGVTEGKIDPNTHVGVRDGFIVKYSSEGDLQWKRQFGSDKSDYAYGVAIDNSGMVYVAGHTIGSLSTAESSGEYDGFIVKYNAIGTKLWTQQFGSVLSDYVHGIAISRSDEIYVTGRTFGQLTTRPRLGNSTDAYIIKYNSSGSQRWIRQFGTIALDQGHAIAVDDAGFVYVTGATAGAMDGNLNSGAEDIFLIKFSGSGAKLWTQQMGTSARDEGLGITIDSSGFIYISGYTESKLGIDPWSGKQDIFTSKYNISGTKLWTQQFGSTERDRSNAIALGSSSQLYVTGNTEGKLNNTEAFGMTDVFVARMCDDSR